VFRGGCNPRGEDVIRAADHEGHPEEFRSWLLGALAAWLGAGLLMSDAACEHGI
jgi:hypothetical protein